MTTQYFFDMNTKVAILKERLLNSDQDDRYTICNINVMELIEELDIFLQLNGKNADEAEAVITDGETVYEWLEANECLFGFSLRAINDLCDAYRLLQ